MTDLQDLGDLVKWNEPDILPLADAYGWIALELETGHLRMGVRGRTQHVYGGKHGGSELMHC